MNMPLFQNELILRGPQEKVINQARESIKKNQKIVVMAPCGFGKTILSTYMLKQSVKKGLRCAFICDRISLIKQTSEVFAKYGIDHGVIQGQHPLYDPLASVQVCSIQTLSRRKYEPFDFVIIDECHTLFKKHKEILAETKFAIGLSATPWTKGLGRYFNDLVCAISIKELIELNYLSDFIVYGPKTIDMTGAKVVAGDYKKDELAERSDTKKIVGDIVSHWVKHARKRKTIVFCVNTAHANHVEKEFLCNGIKAKAINCYMKSSEIDDEVDKALEDFKQGRIQVLVSVDMVSKGFDQPDVDCLVLARPTKSLMMHVQQIGRGLRKGGADKCLILDHAGNTERLGFVDEIDINVLDGGKHKEGKTKKKEKTPRLPTTCPSCDYLKPAEIHKCPACGFEPKNIKNIDVEEGELQEVKRKKKDRKEYSLEEKQEFLGGLNTYAAEKGMKRHWKGFYGWALYQYQDKFGCKPSAKIDWAAQGAINEDVKNFITHCYIKKSKSKNKIEQKCNGCGGRSFIEMEVDNIHKIQVKCKYCGKHFKWGRL